MRRIVSTSRPDARLENDRICYGRWNGEDLVVVRTSKTTWEVQCHGGLVAVRRICNDLASDGFVEESAIAEYQISKESDSDRQRMSVSMHHAVHHAILASLPKAGSRKTAGLILAQASNSLHDDLTLLQTAALRDSQEAETIRQRLGGWRDVAQHLTEPWRVVLVGPPNVGKSSLMNAIAGMERSIVCDQPGTTRDIVEVETMINGWPFRFVDTAGLRESTQDLIEEHGIRHSLLAASACDVLCMVIDQSQESENWIRSLTPSSLPKHRIILQNKSDLLHGHDEGIVNRLPQILSRLPIIKISAHTHDGLPDLLTWIVQAVVPEEPDCMTALPLATLPFDLDGGATWG